MSTFMDLRHYGGAVSLHVLLTERTRNIIGSQELALKLPSSVIVNTARAGLIDEEALAVALRVGWIGAASLDVTCEEPLPPTSAPQGAPRLVITPHTGSATPGARRAMSVRNTLDVIHDVPPLPCINPEIGVSSG